MSQPIIRRFRRKFSISATRLAVRPHVPWYVRWGLALPFLAVVGWMVWWAYDYGLALAGYHRGQAEKELAELRDRVGGLEEEKNELLNQIAAYDRQMQIEHAAGVEVETQIKTLTDENSRLKEDLLFFQNLPLTGSREAELSIHRLKIEPDKLPGEYHCRMLLVQSVQQRGKEFRGSLQLVVNAEQDGQKVVLQFPEQDAQLEDEAHKLSFKYYQRIDKVIKLPPDMQIESVQVRVYEKGVAEPKTKQTVTLEQSI